MKVAVITNIVTAYRYPIFAALHGEAGLQLQFFLSAPLDQSCPEARSTLQLNHCPAGKLWLRTRHETSGALQSEPLPLPLGLIRDLLNYRPDVVIAGDWGIRSFFCYVAARLVGARFVVWSEDIASSAQHRTRMQKLLRRFLARRALAFLAWGTPARNYLSTLNAHPDRIYECAQAVDNAYWTGMAARLDRSQQRQSFGFTGTVYLLVGRLVPRKGFAQFLRAWQMLPRELHAQSMAVIVGEGEQAHELRQLIADCELSNVILAGYTGREELAKYYAAADVFVLPSLEDVWGLAVNEALCFGLPVLASRYSGAGQGLIAGSRAGVLFDPANLREFADCLTAWQKSRDVAPETCRAIVGNSSYAHSVDAIKAMLRDIGRHAPARV